MSVLNRAAKEIFLVVVVALSSAYISSYFFDSKEQRLVSTFDLSSAFDRSLDLNYLSRVRSSELSGMILPELPKNLRTEAEKYVVQAITESLRQGVDPFWAIAVMWTESHFNPKAVSPKGALGLMQIMPKTFSLISSDLTSEMLFDAAINLEFGVRYLKSLLTQFNQNYYFATLAYNLGPGRVSKFLLTEGESQLRDHYYFKVKDKYSTISDSYRRFVQVEKFFYTQTYVYSKRGKKSKSRFLDLSLSAILLDHRAPKVI